MSSAGTYGSHGARLVGPLHAHAMCIRQLSAVKAGSVFLRSWWSVLAKTAAEMRANVTVVTAVIDMSFVARKNSDFKGRC